MLLSDKSFDKLISSWQRYMALIFGVKIEDISLPKEKRPIIEIIKELNELLEKLDKE